MVRRIMAVLGLLAFAVAILGGVASGNRLEFILPRALWAMGAFCTLGLVVGWSAQRVLQEHALKRSTEVLGPPSDDGTSEAPSISEDNSTLQGSEPIES